MKILTDVDGVLLNWEDAFHAFMRDHGYVPEHKWSYELSKCYPNLDPSDVAALIERFNASAAMGFLPPLQDAVYWVKQMHEHHGVVLHCITSMGNDPHAQKLRRMNLNRIFGHNVIDEVTILNCGEDKKNVLSQYKGTNLVWLEDNIHNAVTGAKIGLKTYLFNRTYNKYQEDDKYFTRVNSWKELYENLFEK